MKARIACQALAVTVMVVLPSSRFLRAQNTSMARLDSATMAAIARLADSVRALSLPDGQLISLAQEGALRHASAEQVLAAVREYAAALADSKRALGAKASSEEIISGAGLLVAHVGSNMLVMLRQARLDGSLTVPLVVVADFIARGVTTDLAFTTVSSALHDGVDDAELSAFRNAVADAIRAGVPPAAAITQESRSLQRKKPSRWHLPMGIFKRPPIR